MSAATKDPELRGMLADLAVGGCNWLSTWKSVAILDANKDGSSAIDVSWDGQARANAAGKKSDSKKGSAGTSANNAALGVLALVAWVVIVGVVVWLGEKAVEKFASASAEQRREPMPQ